MKNHTQCERGVRYWDLVVMLSLIIVMLYFHTDRLG